MNSYANFNIFLFLFVASLTASKLCFCEVDGLPSSLGSSSCIEEERRALVSFKQDVIDATGRLSSWVGHDCCPWKGISCNNRTGHILRVDLRNGYPYIDEDARSWTPAPQLAYERNWLRGKINPSLVILKHLHYLDLSGNNFERIHIPKFFGQLKCLKYLNISYANFGGEIPPSLANLSNLNFLSRNFLKTSSKNLNWLSPLSSLDLSGCFLPSTFPASLGKLKTLKYLTLNSNYILGSLPESVGNLSYLKTLVLFENAMNGSIPESLGQLSELVELSLSSNFWKGFLLLFLG